MRKALLLALPILAVGLVGPALAGTTTVTERDLGTGWYTADTRTPGQLTFETVGERGSARLSTADSSAAKVQLLTDAYDGMTLADITELSYTSWRDSSSTGFVAGSAALNLVVDRNSDSVGDTYVVYEPYQDRGNAAVKTDEWQTWDAIAGGNARWWINTGAGGCGQGPTCTWTRVLEILGDAPLAAAAPRQGVDLTGSLGLNLGSGNAGMVTAVDSLTVNGTTYDFGPYVYTKADCKDGGWSDAGHGTAFKNQGDCVSSYSPSTKATKQ